MGGGWLAVWAPTEWRRRWPGLLALAVLVAVAGGVATGLAGGARRAESSVERFLDATGAPNLVAQVPFGEELSGEPFAPPTGAMEVLDDFAAIPGVQSATVESWWAIALNPEIDPPGVVTAFATGTFAGAGEPASPLLVDGRLPGPDDPDGVIVNEAAVEELGLHVGSKLRFDTVSPAGLGEWAANDGNLPSTDALDGPRVEVRVAAVGRGQYDIGEEPFPLVFFPEGFALANRDAIAHAEPFVYLRADPSRLDDVRAAAQTIGAPYGIEILPAPSVGESVAPTVGVEVTTLRTAAAVAAVAGALVLVTLLGRQARAIGLDTTTGAALGLTRSQRASGSWLVLAPAVVLGAFGVPLVAWGLSGLFPRGLARVAEPEPGLRVDVPTLLAGALLSAAVGLGALALIAVASTRTAVARRPARPGAASWLRGSPVRQLGASFAVDPTGTGGRSRVGAAATVCAIALGVSGVTTVATIEASRTHLLGSPRLFGAPTEMVYESNGTFGVAEVVATALSTDGVAAVTRMIAIDEDSLTASGPTGSSEVEPEAYATLRGGAVPPIVAGAYPQVVDEVALGEQTADELGADVGDIVQVTALGATVPSVLRVSGLVVALRSTDVAGGFVMTPEGLVRLVCEDTPADECGTVDVFADVADDRARVALIDAGFEDVPAPGGVDRLDQVGAVPWYLAGFLCVLAAAGLLQAVLTASRRRRADLAIVRAIGLPGPAAARTLSWQAVLIALAGTAGGAVLGVIVGPLVWRLIAADLGVIVVPVVPALGVALSVVLGLAVAVLVSLGPRWSAARRPLATVLRRD